MWFRWFPQTERAAAIGLISGGRQIGQSINARLICWGKATLGRRFHGNSLFWA